MASKGLKTEDTKTEHPFQAIVVCDGWGDEERWGPLVRRKRTEDEEYDHLEVGGEQRSWVSDDCFVLSTVNSRVSLPRRDALNATSTSSTECEIGM